MYTSKITVRYAETDQMGIAHHSNYPVWFEVARTDFIKASGISYSEVEGRHHHSAHRADGQIQAGSLL